MASKIAYALGREKFAYLGNMAFTNEANEGLTAHVNVTITRDRKEPRILDIRNAIGNAVAQTFGAEELDAHASIGVPYGAVLLKLPSGEFVALKAYIGIAEEEDVAWILHDSDQIDQWAKWRQMKAEHEGRKANEVVSSIAAQADGGAA